RAASGHAAAAPPIAAINFRRLIVVGIGPFHARVAKRMERYHAASKRSSRSEGRGSWAEGSLRFRRVRCSYRCGLKPRLPTRRVRAITGREQVQQDTPEKARPTYSITSSARSGSAGGMERPSAFAVFMLITSSNLVGA